MLEKADAIFGQIKIVCTACKKGSDGTFLMLGNHFFIYENASAVIGKNIGIPSTYIHAHRIPNACP